MIEQVIINNFRSIKQCTLPLERLNVLIGTNGVGKSNFIAFFELVHAIYKQQLGLYTLEHGGIDNLLHFGRKHSEYIEGLIDFANTNAFFFKLRPSQTNKGFLEYTGDFFNAKRMDRLPRRKMEQLRKCQRFYPTQLYPL